VGGNSHLVRQQDQHAIAAGGQGAHAFAQGAGEAFFPAPIDHDRACGMLQQRRELLGVRAKHHRNGLAAHFRGNTDCPVQQWSPANARELLW
jgi:hypothetical protein